jgi:hypothetical protein
MPAFLASASKYWIIMTFQVTPLQRLFASCGIVITHFLHQIFQTLSAERLG